jgi:hypothetical protein
MDAASPRGVTVSDFPKRPREQDAAGALLTQQWHTGRRRAAHPKRH